MARKRVQFIFPSQTVQRIDRLKNEMGASSRAEVLRTAVELLSWAVLHLARGEEVAAVRGEEISETIALPGSYSSAFPD